MCGTSASTIALAQRGLFVHLYLSNIMNTLSEVLFHLVTTSKFLSRKALIQWAKSSYNYQQHDIESIRAGHSDAWKDLFDIGLVPLLQLWGWSSLVYSNYMSQHRHCGTKWRPVSCSPYKAVDGKVTPSVDKVESIRVGNNRMLLWRQATMHCQ